MKKFKNRWDLIGLYNICSDYLQNQTEENAINFIERVEAFKEKYPITEVK